MSSDDQVFHMRLFYAIEPAPRAGLRASFPALDCPEDLPRDGACA